MLSSRAIMSQRTSLRIIRSSNSSSTIVRATSGAFRHGYAPISTRLINQRRCYSSAPSASSTATSAPIPSKTEQNNQLEAPNAPHIRRTETSWPHPIFSYKGMQDIEVAHRPTQSFSDKFALGAVRFLRTCMDKATGYKAHTNTDKSVMTERKWLIRFIFLESVAGVPGMVGGMLRHLSSLRRMKRDNGWIESLLEEAFNERMHLLTFLKLQTPGIFMRTMILGAQGVFFNGFFLCYLVSPKTCHRFVGYLEEEAVMTYTHALSDLDAGRLPLWNKMQAPQIAIEYWNMPEGNRTMKDLLLYVRADEAKHREVNHTLGNLDPQIDPNPFVSVYEDPSKPHPSKGLKDNRAIGWTREEAL